MDKIETPKFSNWQVWPNAFVHLVYVRVHLIKVLPIYPYFLILHLHNFFFLTLDVNLIS